MSRHVGAIEHTQIFENFWTFSKYYFITSVLYTIFKQKFHCDSRGGPRFKKSWVGGVSSDDFREKISHLSVYNTTITELLVRQTVPFDLNILELAHRLSWQFVWMS